MAPSSRLMTCVLPVAIVAALLLAGGFVPPAAALAPSIGTNGLQSDASDADPDLLASTMLQDHSATETSMLASDTCSTSACDANCPGPSDALLDNQSTGEQGSDEGCTIEAPTQDLTHEGEVGPPPVLQFHHTVRPAATCSSILTACNNNCGNTLTYLQLASCNNGKPCCYGGCPLPIPSPPVPVGTVLNYQCGGCTSSAPE